MRNNKEKCVHTNKVWKGEIQFCLVCAKKTDFKDMTLEVVYPKDMINKNK